MSGNGKLSKFPNPFKLQGLLRSDKAGHGMQVGEVCIEMVLSGSTFVREIFPLPGTHLGENERGGSSRANSLIRFFSVYCFILVCSPDNFPDLQKNKLR